ncbi:MAG: ABC transporter substrate-binding protein [Actinomycetota bacterium]
MRERWLRLLAALLAFTLVAAACGGGDDDDAEDGAATDGLTAEDGDTDAGSGDEPEEGGAEVDPDEELGNVDVDEEAADCATAVELEVGEYNPGPALRYVNSISLASGLNPHNDQAPAAISFYSWVFEGLVRQEIDGSIGPWLAKCWETNETGDQITFFLHEGVTFHDGAPFNAEAVVANAEFIKTAGPPAVLPPVAGQLAIVDSVEALDEFTVRYNLTGPGEALLLSGLIRNSGFMVSPNALGTEPIGTGPYVSVGGSEDGTNFELEGFADYWQPQLVGAEAVTIDVIPDAAARLDALNAGQYDLGTIQENQRADAANISVNSTVRIGFVVADWTGEQIPQLANKEVRCAMAQALNREGIRAAAGAEDSNAQFAASANDYAYIDDLDPSILFDIEAAKARMEASGEDGFEFDNAHLPGGFWPATSSAWGGALSELGITMNNSALDPPSAGEMFVRLAQGQYPVQIVAFNEPNALMSLIARTGTGGLNPSGVSPDGVDELVASARTKSFDEGEADVAAAWKIMIEECIFIINHTLSTTLAYNDGVEGVVHVQGIPITAWPQGIRKSG